MIGKYLKQDAGTFTSYAKVLEVEPDGNYWVRSHIDFADGTPSRTRLGGMSTRAWYPPPVEVAESDVPEHILLEIR